MPALTATATTTEEVKLSPKVRQKLLQEFRAYAALSAKIKELETQKGTIKDRIQAIREDEGVGSLSLDGFTTTMVAPVRRVFDEKLFVRNGGDIEVYRQSMVDKPSKAYEKVTVPGSKGDE